MTPEQIARYHGSMSDPADVDPEGEPHEMTDVDRYPCPDKRCPGLIELHHAYTATAYCPYCGEGFAAETIRQSPPWQTWKAAPKTAENSHVQFWSMPIKRRLEQSTIGANQAAKRDLAAYADIIAAMLPPVQRATAIALTRHLMTRKDELATPGTIIAGWNDVIDAVCGTVPVSGRDLNAHRDLYLPALLAEKYALIDAADRCIKDYGAAPEPHLAEIVARHFRITPERS